MSSWSLSSAGISASALRLAAIAPRCRRLPPPRLHPPPRPGTASGAGAGAASGASGPGAPGEQRRGERPHRSVTCRVIGRGWREDRGEKRRWDAVLPCPACRAAPCTRRGRDAPRKGRELLRARLMHSDGSWSSGCCAFSEAAAEAADAPLLRPPALCRRRWQIRAGSWGGPASGMCPALCTAVCRSGF